MGKLNFYFSRQIQRALKANKKGRSWEMLVGYSLIDLKNHLQDRFKTGMDWHNYGEWHIDHIIPVSWFNFEYASDPEFKKCWDLDNLQPLWAEENMKKGNRLAGG